VLGNVYEKRLIEAYIEENHKDPVNGEELDITDLIDLKSSRIVAPRPPTLTSIPSLLSTFQNEWDALALESFNLRQQLQQTRQELATALYQHDAAVRVIARLTRERDEARDALSKVTIGAGGASNGDAMQIDSQGLPEDLAAKVDATQEKYEINIHFKETRMLIVDRLSKSRRKRPVPKEWADAELIEKFGVATSSKALHPGAKSLAVDEAGQLVVFGGDDGVAGIFSIPENKAVESFKAGSAVTDAAWYGSQPVVSTASGAVKVFGDSETTFTSHAGSANGLTLHPSGDILASVGVDKSFVFYDLQGGKPVTQVYTDSGMGSHKIALGNTKSNLQNLQLLHSIRTDISSLLEALMGKSSYSMSRQVKMLPISI
jgi:pre-mRNA-processing factor 19